MELAHRYAALLNAPDGMLREAPAEEFSAHKSELELQAHWFAGDFGANFLTATTGERWRSCSSEFGTTRRDRTSRRPPSVSRIVPARRWCAAASNSIPGRRTGNGTATAANAAFDGVVLHLYLQHGTRQVRRGPLPGHR